MDHRFTEEDLVIVGGAPRSGTTLVQRVLGQHPDIYGGPEFDFLPPIADLWSRFRRSVDTGRTDAYFSVVQVDELFREFILAAFSRKATAAAVRMISEKTPSNVLVFPELLQILPKSKFVFVLRDPRSIVSSMLEVGRRERKRGLQPTFYTRNVHVAVRYVRECWTRGFLACDGSENVRVVYYEDMVERPMETAKSLTDFVGVAYSDAMIALEGRPMEMASSERIQDWYTRDQLREGIDASRKEKWRMLLSPYELHVVQKLRDLDRDETRRYFPATTEGGPVPKMGFLARDLLHSSYSGLIQRLAEEGRRIRAHLP